MMHTPDFFLLPNGAIEDQRLVKLTRVCLKVLREEEPDIYAELLRMCLDANHQPLWYAEERLKELSLIYPNGRVHESTRNIVLWDEDFL